MSTIPDSLDETGISTIESIFLPTTKSIVGNMVISFSLKDSLSIQKRINRIEDFYKDQIVSKNQHFISHHAVIFIIFEGLVQDFQKLVVEINSIKEISNFRYMILK